MVFWIVPELHVYGVRILIQVDVEWGKTSCWSKRKRHPKYFYDAMAKRGQLLVLIHSESIVGCYYKHLLNGGISLLVFQLISDIKKWWIRIQVRFQASEMIMGPGSVRRWYRGKIEKFGTRFIEVTGKLVNKSKHETKNCPLCSRIFITTENCSIQGGTVVL